MTRRKGRILAVQALYSYEVGGMQLEDLLKLDWDEDFAEGVDAGSVAGYDFARILIAGTINHLAEVDALIKGHLSGKWEFSRVNKISLAILRMSVFSLLYLKDMHPTIVIDEAVGIAKDYGADDSFKFINAVLDTIRKELQQNELPS